MPELPEVEALRLFLTDAAVGQVVARAELASFTCLKTVEPPLTALGGLEVEQVSATASSWPSRSAACGWPSTWPAPVG